MINSKNNKCKTGQHTKTLRWIFGNGYCKKCGEYIHD